MRSDCRPTVVRSSRRPARSRLAAAVVCCAAAAIAAATAADIGGPAQRDRKEQGGPLPPGRAAAAMTLPAGFTATLFAAEPDVHQPIGFCLDHRGRLWVAENDAYPKWEPDGRDKVVIFEDTDGDGKADKRTVFVDHLHYVTGVLVGPGGVWVLDCPTLLFFPVEAGADKPSGPPVVHLDGWDPKGVHNLPNSLTWGPDGWLYGCNGTIFDVAIGPPGTPADRRTKMNRGVWRYHPRKRAFETFAEGTANPWGLDYDERGQLFMTNNVVAHLWHVVQGGHYPRVNYGSDSNPHTYTLLPPAADHLHYAGGDWTASRGGEGAHGVAGGGHSHAGCMIYLGKAFPPEYRGTLFMCNTHGHRMNRDAPDRRGSGFVAGHRPDFLVANDPWFKGVSGHYGPDGSVYVIDWSDTGECHDVDVTDREHGRIFRIAYTGVDGGKGGATTKAAPPRPDDLSLYVNDALIDMQAGDNEWYVRHARDLLRERGLDEAQRHKLTAMLEGAADPRTRLRAMWALHACGGVGEARLLKALADGDEYVRAWAVQLLAEDKDPPDTALEKFKGMAAGDPSPVVRLYLACAMQRTPPARRRGVLEALLAHAEDAADPNLPAMDWYALEPLVGADAAGAAALLARVKIPLVRELTARRAAEGDGLAGLVASLAGADGDDAQAAQAAQVRLDVLRGIGQALKDVRHAPAPAGWAAASRRLSANPDAAVRGLARSLSAKFGAAPAPEALRAKAADAKADAAERLDAVESLLGDRAPGLPPLLRQIMAEPAGPAGTDLRRAAIRGLAGYNDAEAPAALLKAYPSLAAAEKAEAINALASRRPSAAALIDAVRAGTIPRADVTAHAAQLLDGLGDPCVTRWVAENWGAARPTDADKRKEIDRVKAVVLGAAPGEGRASRGRAVFARTCAGCHTLFGEGGKVGPDLTGTQRGDLDFLLTSVVDPAAVVPQEYQVWVARTKDGQVLSGILARQDERSVTLAGPNAAETRTLPRGEIDRLRPTTTSLMPEGLLQGMPRGDLLDLVEYLRGPGEAERR